MGLQKSAGAGYAVSKPDVHAVLVPTVFLVSRLGMGEENGSHQLFCFCRSLSKIPDSLIPALRLVKISSNIFQAFLHSSFHAASQTGSFLSCIFKGGDSVSYHPHSSSRGRPSYF